MKVAMDGQHDNGRKRRGGVKNSDIIIFRYHYYYLALNALNGSRLRMTGLQNEIRNRARVKLQAAETAIYNVHFEHGFIQPQDCVS